jgi:hypothetical protein
LQRLNSIGFDVWCNDLKYFPIKFQPLVAANAVFRELISNVGYIHCMSIAEHIFNLSIGAVAGVSGVYVRRRSKRAFLLYLSFCVMLVAVLICAWYWIKQTSHSS